MMTPLPRTLLARLLPIGLLAMIVGCAGSAPVAPTTPPEPVVSERSFRTVVVDSSGRADHGQFVCYLGRARVTASDYEDDFETVVYIQDDRFVDIGYFLASGATYRLEADRLGEIHETFLGNHEPPRSVELVTGVSGPFLFVDGL